MAQSGTKEGGSPPNPSKELYGILREILWREEQVSALESVEEEEEQFWVFGLMANHKMLFLESIPFSRVGKVLLVEPIEVFSLALQKQAVQVILCHSIPKGKLQPSDTEKDVADRLIQVGRLLELPVLDYLLVNSQTFYSFEEKGLMEQLSYSLKYVPPYLQAQRIQEIAQSIVQSVLQKEQDNTLQQQISSARAMKKDGMEVLVIAKYTGLSPEQIEAL